MGKDRIGKLAICLLLVMSILALSCSSFAAGPVDPDGGGALEEQVLLYYIWLTMQAWGIDVTVSDVQGYSEAAEQWILSEVYDYLATQPSVGDFLFWAAPWAFNFNPDTNVLNGNSNFLEDMEDFVKWLQVKWNLTDNQDLILRSVSYIRFINRPDEPIYVGDYGTSVNNWYPEWNYLAKASVFDGFELEELYLCESNKYVKFQMENDGIYLNISDNEDLSNPVVHYRMVASSQYNEFFAEYHGTGYYYNGTNRFPVFYNNRTSVNNQFAFGIEAYHASETKTRWTVNRPITEAKFMEYFMPRESVEKIETGSLVIPDEGIDYEDGQSIVIRDGTPVYITIDWPSEVTVENLPAVISPTTITDPDLEGVYGEVTPFIRTFSGGMDMMRSIIMQLPEEVIACLYALMGAIIIFGFIKIMREH